MPCIRQLPLPQTDLSMQGRLRQPEHQREFAPGDMKNVARRAVSGGKAAADRFMVCERGASFGYK